MSGSLLLIGVVPPSAPRAPGAAQHVRLRGKRWDVLALPVDEPPTGEAEDRWIAWARLQNAVLSAQVVHDDVLPVKLGAVFSSREALLSHIDARSDDFDGLARALAGSVEFVVQLLTDGSRRHETHGPACENGTEYLLHRREARDRRGGARNRRQEFTHTLGRDLGDLGRRTVGRPSKVADRLADWSVLLPRGGVHDFLRRLDMRNEQAGALGLSLKVVGPLPPFAFIDHVKVPHHA
jgi:hypothetical protein